jgi:hypothetical protein
MNAKILGVMSVGILVSMACLTSTAAELSTTSEGEWYSYGPIQHKTLSDSGPKGGPAEQITFSPQQGNKEPYWCGAGVKWKEPLKMNLLTMTVNASPKHHVDIKVFDSRGQAFDSGSQQPYNVAHQLYDLHYLHDGAAFPLDESYDLDNYETIVYSACEPPQGFAEALGKWVAADPSRTLVTHSFIPTRYSAPAKILREGNERFAFLQDGGQEKSLGFQTIRGTNVVSGRLQSQVPVIAAALNEFLGRDVRFSRDICDAPGGKALINLGDQPLVSEHKCGQGRVIYLHFFASNTAADQTEQRLEKAILDAVMRYLGYRPFAVMPENQYALVFDRPQGGKSVITYNSRAVTHIQFNGNLHQVFQAQDPEVLGTGRLLMGPPKTEFRLSDMITGKRWTARTDEDGYVAIPLDGWNMRGVYVDPTK